MSTDTREIKTTLKFRLSPVRMILIKIINNNKCYQVCGKKGTLIHCLWKCKLV